MAAHRAQVTGDQGSLARAARLTSDHGDLSRIADAMGVKLQFFAT